MVGMSSPLVFCNKIRVFVTLSDFSENLAKVWQGQKNSNPIERGERPTLSHRFELSYTSLGQKLTEIGFLFVCLLSSAFLQSFHYCSFSLVKRTINLVIFSSNFQGFTLVPWQKVGRICSKCLLYISQILFFPLPVNERYGTEAKISNFSSLIWFPNTLFFIQAFQNATFGVKSTALSQKLSKLAIFHLF